jgi:hypothetical protein
MLRMIAMTSVVFGVVGPSIGAVVIWLERPPTGFGDVVLLSYIFGGIPALIAGVAYGGLRARRHGSPFRWYARVLLGAGAGLFGCVLFFLLVSAYDLLTVSEPSVRDVHLGFLRRLVLAGIPAGIVCALLIGSAPRRPA